MLAKQKRVLDYGYNSIMKMDGKYSDMMMDFGILKLKSDQEEIFNDDNKESAYLLIEGKIVLKWGEEEKTISRESCFDEAPYVLHVPKGVGVKITAKCESEILIQKTNNERDFDAVFYTPGDYRVDTFGDNLMNNTAKRQVKTIFDFENAPYSNMVLGEVIDYPGKWSSYPPHSHQQPEIYYYRFNKLQGFGASFIGDNVFKVENNDAVAIPGGLVHPQVTAPGYAMYYCWMIRHLDNNPWTDRVDDPDHKWLYNQDAKIWPAK